MRAADLLAVFLAGAFSARGVLSEFVVSGFVPSRAALSWVAPSGGSAAAAGAPSRPANQVSSTSRVTADWALLISTPIPAMAARNSLLVMPTARAAACARIRSGSALRSSMVRFGSDTCLLWPDSGRDLVAGTPATHAAARGRAILVSAPPGRGHVLWSAVPA